MDLTTEQMLARISDDELKAAAIARDLCVSKSKHETLRHRLWIRTIVRRPLDSSGDLTDVAVLAESVLMGVADAMIALGAPADVLDLIHANAKHRQAQLRLVRSAKGSPQ